MTCDPYYRKQLQSTGGKMWTLTNCSCHSVPNELAHNNSGLVRKGTGNRPSSHEATREKGKQKKRMEINKYHFLPPNLATKVQVMVP